MASDSSSPKSDGIDPQFRKGFEAYAQEISTETGIPFEEVMSRLRSGDASGPIPHPAEGFFRTSEPNRVVETPDTTRRLDVTSIFREAGYNVDPPPSPSVNHEVPEEAQKEMLAKALTSRRGPEDPMATMLDGSPLWRGRPAHPSPEEIQQSLEDLPPIDPDDVDVRTHPLASATGSKITRPSSYSPLARELVLPQLQPVQEVLVPASEGPVVHQFSQGELINALIESVGMNETWEAPLITYEPDSPTQKPLTITFQFAQLEALIDHFLDDRRVTLWGEQWTLTHPDGKAKAHDFIRKTMIEIFGLPEE